MKNLIFLSTLFLLSAFIGAESCQQHDPYIIDIKEESMLWTNTCIVTEDSILISKTHRIDNSTQHFSIKLTKEESAEIEKLFRNINLKTLKQNYTDPNAPADFYAYYFTFVFDDNTTRKVYVYQYRQEEIFKLVQKINQVITLHEVDYQLGYKEGYFQHKK